MGTESGFPGKARRAPASFTTTTIAVTAPSVSIRPSLSPSRRSVCAIAWSLPVTWPLTTANSFFTSSKETERRCTIPTIAAICWANASPPPALGGGALSPSSAMAVSDCDEAAFAGAAGASSDASAPKLGGGTAPTRFACTAATTSSGFFSHIVYSIATARTGSKAVSVL
ncbi:hypothetical protein DIPPA_18905 [Diplonema papillatum]|nr:hypothetical protein DIPPA_18905 [Diplonema papillatum]